MPEQSNNQTDAVRQVVVEALQTELAAVSAAVGFLGEWVRLADSYTRSLGDELTGIRDGTTTVDQTVGRITDLSREYVRNLAGLPAISLRRFSNDIETVGVRKKRRTRSARAKD